MTETLIEWVSSTSLSMWVTEWNWTWVILEILHFFGLCLLLGSLLIIDLRLIGFFRRIPIADTHQILPWTFIGFAINLITGILFYFGQPEEYTTNIGFLIKMLLIVLAGINALWFFVKLDKPMRIWEQHGDTPRIAKLIGSLSLIIWFTVLILGRLIPYVGGSGAG